MDGNTLYTWSLFTFQFYAITFHTIYSFTNYLRWKGIKLYSNVVNRFPRLDHPRLMWNFMPSSLKSSEVIVKIIFMHCSNDIVTRKNILHSYKFQYHYL